MISNIFITSTDTDAGKTLVASALLQYLNTLGKQTLAFKPVSAGCQKTHNGLRNQDAVQLAEVASLKIPYQEINPFAFEAFIAPHIAAEKNKQMVTINNIIHPYHALKKYSADHIMIEGAGGWRLPINSEQYMSDFVKTENIPVILVVGMRLGCINHTVLTYEALQKDGVNLLGWVGNILDPAMQVVEENIAYLESLIDAPLLGVIPYVDNIDFKKALSYLNFKEIF